MLYPIALRVRQVPHYHLLADIFKRLAPLTLGFAPCLDILLRQNSLLAGRTMAQADISVVTESQLPMIVELYNQVFRPAETEDYFRRRFQGRYNVLVMLASLDNRPVGFTIGFELKPFVFYNWLTGVHGDFRR